MSSGKRYPMSTEVIVATAAAATAAAMAHTGQQDTPSRVCKQILDANWMRDFRVPWQVMPLDLMNALEKGEKPSLAERRQLTRLLVAAMRAHDMNPNLAKAEHVARLVVEKYPESFKDCTDNGKVISTGHQSLTTQIKNRIEHVNRHHSTIKYKNPDMDDPSVIAIEDPTIGPGGHIQDHSSNCVSDLAHISTTCEYLNCLLYYKYTVVNHG